jgi:hypothetical protein
MIGYNYFERNGTYWRVLHHALIPLSMPHAVKPPTYFGALRMLIQYRAPLIRWEYDFDRPVHSDWWHIIKDIPECMESLSSNTRSKVRRGNNNFSVTRTTREIIATEGYKVYAEAFSYYDTFEKMLKYNDFKSAINSLPPETEFWTVRCKDKGNLVAFSENIVRDGACFYNTIWFNHQGRRGYASYALIFEMNKYYLNSRGVRYVSDGSRSLSHDTEIHQFLIQKFRFRKAYSALGVQYLPGVGLIILILSLCRFFPERKGSGLFSKIRVLLAQEAIRKSFLDTRNSLK